MNAILIVNPIAGARDALEAAEIARKTLIAGGWEASVTVTTRAGGAAELAKEAAGNCDVVVGVGGDGTLSELFNGLAASKVQGGTEAPVRIVTPVGLIPAGTGNDFARFAGIQDNAEAAAKQIIEGKPRAIDLGRIVGNRLFVNTVGAGFDAAVAGRINRRKRISRGLAAYLPAVLAELAGGHHLAAKVTVDGQVFEDEWLLVAVANGNAYGAGFQIAPHAEIDSGALEVVLVQRMGRLEALCNLKLCMAGQHESLPKVRMLRGRHIEIETETPAPALVDGDLLAETPLAIDVLPSAGTLWS